MSLPRFSTRRPVAIAMLFLAIALLGVISYARLPIDLLPDISYPKLVVFTSYPNVAPAEVERLITERVEARAAGCALTLTPSHRRRPSRRRPLPRPVPRPVFL